MFGKIGKDLLSRERLFSATLAVISMVLLGKVVDGDDD
jgi:hypothetical protein